MQNDISKMNDPRPEKDSGPSGKGGKRIGCWLMLLLLSIIWLFGTWHLWRLSLQRQDSDKQSDSSTSFFEIIPGSDERTSVEDELEDRVKSPGKIEE